MFMHVDHPESMYYHVYDWLTRQEIVRCIWADEENGMYCRYKLHKKTGESFIKDGDIATEVRRGKIKIIYED